MHPIDFHSKCLLCASDKLTPLKGYEKFYLVKCANCSMIFTKYIPTANDYKQNYDNYSRNDFLSPITIKRYNEILDNFEKYRKHNKILDVGCGIGYFLEIAQQRGWQVYGTEFSEHAINLCKQKGIIVYKGKLLPDMFNANSFDIITSFEVIEHINYPNEEIFHIYNFLRTGGLFYITTPNFNSLLRYYLRANYSYIIGIPDHLCYFTPHTLTYLMKKHGFKKHKISTTGINISSFFNPKIDSASLVINQTSQTEKTRRFFEKNTASKLLKLFINNTLSLLGIGDTIKAIYIK